MVDSLKADQPILDWSEFIRGCDSLHEPVARVLKLYLAHAGLIRGTALEALNRALADRLANGL